MINVSYDLLVLDNGTVIMFLIVFMSPLELVKCLLVTAYRECKVPNMCPSPPPFYGRSQAVCHDVQEVCEPNCSRQWEGSPGRSRAHP